MSVLYKNWFVHNVIGHPLMQMFNMVGCNKIATTIHNETLPKDFK